MAGSSVDRAAVLPPHFHHVIAVNIPPPFLIIDQIRSGTHPAISKLMAYPRSWTALEGCGWLLLDTPQVCRSGQELDEMLLWNPVVTGRVGTPNRYICEAKALQLSRLICCS